MMFFASNTRMKNLCLLTLLVVGLLLTATRCVQPVEIAPPEEREVFVKCILEKGATHQQVLLLYSGGIGEDQFEPVTNAAVTINGHKFENLGDGLYDRHMEPRDGETYTLQVSIPGRDMLEATTTMPRYFSFSSWMIAPEERTKEIGGIWGDIATLPYIRPCMWMQDIVLSSYEQAKQLGGRTLNAEMPGMLFRLDSLAKDGFYYIPGHHHLYILGRIEDSTGVIAPIRELATNHLLVDKVNENGRSYQVATEPAIPDTAIKPKYERIIKKYYEGLALHDGYLRIDYPENYDNGLRNIYETREISYHEKPYTIDVTRYFVIVGDFEYNYWGTTDLKQAHPVLYFCSVSEEYDRYLRSVQTALVNAEGDLLSTLYGEASGYSNVKGGYGIFGAVSTLRHDCDLKWGYYWMAGYVPYSPYPAQLPAL